MKIKNENIKGYLESVSSDIPKRKLLWCYFSFYLIVALPTALFGGSDVIKFLILIFTVLLGVWTVYLSFDIEKKEVRFTLFQGLNSFILSVILLIAAYNVVSTVMKLKLLTIIGIVVFYCICLNLNILNIVRLINKGYYQSNNRKGGGSPGVIFAVSILGLGVGRALSGKVSQDTVAIIFASILLFLSFIFQIGTHNLLKYYFYKYHTEK